MKRKAAAILLACIGVSLFSCSESKENKIYTSSTSTENLDILTPTLKDSVFRKAEHGFFTRLMNSQDNADYDEQNNKIIYYEDKEHTSLLEKYMEYDKNNPYSYSYTKEEPSSLDVYRVYYTHYYVYLSCDETSKMKYDTYKKNMKNGDPYVLLYSVSPLTYEKDSLVTQEITADEYKKEFCDKKELTTIPKGNIKTISSMHNLGTLLFENDFTVTKLSQDKRIDYYKRIFGYENGIFYPEKSLLLDIQVNMYLEKQSFDLYRRELDIRLATSIDAFQEFF